MLPGICAAVITFLVFLVAVVVRFHLPRVRHRLQTMTRIWALLLVVYAGIYRTFETPSLTSLEGIIFFGNGVVIYLLSFLAFCYCYFVSDHSLSVLYLMTLEDRSPKRLSPDELKQTFPYDDLLAQRLCDLEANDLVLREGDHYRLTGNGTNRARVAGKLKTFLNLEPGG